MSQSESSVQCDNAIIEEILDSASFIRQSDIKNAWRQLRDDLKRRGYNTAGINLPSIKAFVLPFDKFLTLNKTLKRKHPRWQENNPQEHGRPIAVEESAAFLAYTGDRYIIGISEMAVAYSRVDPLGHELLHVWETKLHLAAGTLTKECDDFLQGLRSQQSQFKGRKEKTREREIRP